MKRSMIANAQILVLVVLSIQLLPSTGYCDLIWIDNAAHQIRRSNDSGGSQTTIVSLSADNSNSLAFNPVDQTLFYTRNYSIWQVNADGTGDHQIAGISAGALALDPVTQRLYYSYFVWQSNSNFIGRMNADGSNRIDSLANLGNNGAHFSFDSVNQNLYVATSNMEAKIRRFDADVSPGSNTILVDNAVNPRAIAVDASLGIFWTNNNFTQGIKHASLNGSNVTTLVPGDGLAQAFDIDATSQKMFWIDGDNGGRLKRSNLDGSGIEILIADLGFGSNFIAGKGLVHFTPAPEPGTLVLLLTAGLGLLAYVWRRRRS